MLHQSKSSSAFQGSLEESMPNFVDLKQHGLRRSARIASTEAKSQDGDHTYNLFTNFQSDAEMPILPNPGSITERCFCAKVVANTLCDDAINYVNEMIGWVAKWLIVKT